MRVTDAFRELATSSTYESLPSEVVHETKRALLDSLACGLGGFCSDKGKIGIAMARRMGGPAEATVLGIGDRCSSPVAAFANSELINGLDMDAIAHIPPIVFPAVLAVAESHKRTGRDFLVSATVAQEVAKRLSRSLSVLAASIAKRGSTPDVFGNSNEHIIGAALGSAMLMGLPADKLTTTMGIAAYFCSLPVCRDWESTMPKSMIKYAPVSWLAQGAVQAAMLAGEGYTANDYTLDSEYGFPRFYCREEGMWDPAKVVEDIGHKWFFMDYHYKPYPCCRFLHSSLDCFYRIKERYGLKPGEIQAVRCRTSAFVAHPDQYSVVTQVDGQFSGPYCIALAAYGHKVGAEWQKEGVLTDPEIRNFMRKVTMIVDPKYAELRRKDPRTWYARVEVDARGTTFSDETEYSRGTNVDGYRLTDEDLMEKFRTNASVILPSVKIERAIEMVMKLEEVPDIEQLMNTLMR